MAAGGGLQTTTKGVLKMTIHHAVQKKATTLGFTLIEVDGAVKAESDRVTVFADTAKEALNLVQQAHAFIAEYPWFILELDADEYVVFVGEDEISRSQDLAEAIATALEEQPEAPEDFDAPADELPGTIVPEKYKNEYKARGDATRCGDWLCENLDPYVTNTTGKRRNTNLTLLKEVALANGIDRDWPNLNNGQQAMNTRNMIRSKVKKTGQLVIPGSVVHSKEDLTLKNPEWSPE